MDLDPAQIEVEIPQQQKLQRCKSYVKILAIAANLGLSNFYYGYSLVYLSTVEFKQLITIFTITLRPDIAKGILTGCIPIGAGIGALLGTKLIHVFSRRKLVLIINAVAIVTGCLLYINNFILLLILRVIQGICIGIYTSIIPLYTTEISPRQIKASTSPFHQIFSATGTTVAYLFYFILNAAMAENTDKQLIIWYLILGFPLIPLITQTLLLLFVFPYQTPKYHLLYHQNKKAKQLLAQLYKPEFVQIVYHQKVQDIEFLKKKEAEKEQSRQLQEIAAPTIKISSHTSITSISNNALQGIQRKQTVTPSLAIFTAIHCVILRQFSGVIAVVAYGGDIIYQANKSLRSIVPFFLNAQILIGAILATCILQKFGKRPMLQVGTVILTLSLLLITIGFFILDSAHEPGFILILIGLIVFTFTFGITYGAILWAYVSQIVEPSYNVFTTLINWIFASLVIILFPILKTSVFDGSPSILFLFFCAWMTVSFFVNHKVLVQTKNKKQLQIKKQFLQIQCNPCPCWKKHPVHAAPASSKTQSQLFDVNSINLKLTELKRQKQQSGTFQTDHKKQKQNQQQITRPPLQMQRL